MDLDLVLDARKMFAYSTIAILLFTRPTDVYENKTGRIKNLLDIVHLPSTEINHFFISSESFAKEILHIVYYRNIV